MRTRLCFTVTVVALFLLPGASQAASVSIYTNRSDWATATPNAITTGFEGLAPGFGSIFLPTPPGTTLSNVNFNIDHTSNNGSLYVYGPGFPYAGNSALSTQGSDSGTNNILVTLPAGVSSVGLDFGNLAGAPGNSVRFRLGSGESFTGITGGYDGTSGPRWFNFIGFKSDQPINTLLIEYSDGGSLNIDNFSYALVGADLLNNGNFEISSNGLPAGWIYSQVPGDAVTLESPVTSPFTSVYPAGARSVLLTDGASQDNSPSLRQFFPGVSNDFALSFDFRLGGTSLVGDPWTVLPVGEGGVVAFEMFIDNAGEFRVTDGLVPNTILNLSTGTWYHVEVSGSATVGKYHGSIKPFGGAAVTWGNMAFINEPPQLNQIRGLIFTDDSITAAANSPLYLDNVSFTLADTNAPVLSAQGANLTIQCPAIPVFTAPTATDDRDPNPTITFTNVTTSGTCPGAYSTTRTWVATDQAGNISASVSQTITVEDTTPPILLGLVSDATVSCNNVPLPLTRTAIDNCDTNPTVVFSEVQTPGSCPGNYILTRTWIARDACGNSATNRQVITVQDTTAPLLTGQGTNRTISCPATPVFTAPTATDNCDTNPIIVFADVLTPGTGTTLYTVTRTWTATDRCSNVSASVSQTITVQDVTAPEITCPTNMVVEFTDLSGALVHFSAGAAEGCGSNVVAVCVPASGSTFPIGTTTVHCNATDSSGNSTSCDFTVTVLGARAAKLRILGELVIHRADAGNSPDQKQLDKAIDALVSATNASVWVDENHLVSKSGGRIFDLEKTAAQKFRKLISDSRGPVADELLLDWIARLVNADRLLAQISVEEAASIGGPPKKIAECRQLIAKGDADAAAGRPTVAVGRYRTAWKHAVDLQANPGP